MLICTVKSRTTQVLKESIVNLCSVFTVTVEQVLNET